MCLHIRPCIHRLFLCSVCPCSLVTRHTDNEPLFCLLSGYNIIQTLSKIKVHCLSGVLQLRQVHTPQGNSLWIKGLSLLHLLDFIRNTSMMLNTLFAVHNIARFCFFKNTCIRQHLAWTHPWRHGPLQVNLPYRVRDCIIDDDYNIYLSNINTIT